MHPSRTRAEAHYRDVRLAALQAAEGLCADGLAEPVRLALIGPEALAAHEAWIGHPARRYNWPWRQMTEDLRRAEPGRFELAIWHGGILCGLSLGRLRAGFCRVDYLEGSPLPDHPLRGKVAAVMFTAAVAYATAAGKREIHLTDPLPAVIPHYLKLGFELAFNPDKTPYCRWTIP
jgi:hypothetical protein